MGEREDEERRNGQKRLSEESSEFDSYIEHKEENNRKGKWKERDNEKSLEDKKAKLVIKGVQKQTSSKYVNFKLGLKGKKMTKQKIYCTPPTSTPANK